MGIEQRRGGGHYYYRKVRRGRQVASVYVGSGRFARLAAQVTQMQRQEREQARQAAAAEGALAADQDLAELGTLLDTLVRVVFLDAGYHRHKGQWRKRRTHETTDNEQ
jgi:hypothetical protein